MENVGSIIKQAKSHLSLQCTLNLYTVSCDFHFFLSKHDIKTAVTLS